MEVNLLHACHRWHVANIFGAVINKAFELKDHQITKNAQI